MLEWHGVILPFCLSFKCYHCRNSITFISVVIKHHFSPLHLLFKPPTFWNVSVTLKTSQSLESLSSELMLCNKLCLQEIKRCNLCIFINEHLLYSQWTKPWEIYLPFPPPPFFHFKSICLLTPYMFNISLLSFRYISYLLARWSSFDVGVFKTGWILRRNCFSW